MILRFQSTIESMVDQEKLQNRDFFSMLFPLALTHGKFSGKEKIKSHFYRLPPIQQHFIRFSVEHFFEKCHGNNVELRNPVFYTELLHYQGKE